MSDSSPESEQIFSLQVQLDMAHEKELLYRALLVVECIVLLFLLREFLLAWLIK